MLRHHKYFPKQGAIVWYRKERWTVHAILSPTKHDDYLVLKQTLVEEAHADGTHPVYMTLIDAHNDTFYPETPIVQQIMAERQALQEHKQRQKEVLDEAWLSCFKED